MANKSRKEVIMDTAKILFSQKGYDAAGMEEIAALAGVPKSLIYYHFKSKEELLYGIINDFISEYERLIKLNAVDRVGAGRYFDFLYTHKDFLKIIVMESLKARKNSMPIFEAVRIILQCEGERSGDKELTDYQKSHSRWVAEFFTNIIPFVMLSCYADDWCGYFNTDIEAVKNDFMLAYKQTHENYHKEMETGD